MALVYLKSKTPFSSALQANMAKLWEQFPRRVKAANLYVRQVPREEWQHGKFRGWSSNGSVELKAGEWTKVPGLFVHECGHYGFQALSGPAAQDAWERLWDAHRKDLPTEYARKSPDEGFAECFVCVYRRPVPAGYKALTAGPLVEHIRGVCE